LTDFAFDKHVTTIKNTISIRGGGIYVFILVKYPQIDYCFKKEMHATTTTTRRRRRRRAHAVH
jgi:hypothetical protein